MAARAFAAGAVRWAVGGGLAGAALAGGPADARAQGAVPKAGDLRIELNAAEAAAPGRCRLTFVVENAGGALDALKLDLATFGRDGAIGRRLLAEFGPARAGKTNVRAFDVDGACEALGSVLVNDVSACAPASPGECLDRLALSHRGAVRLFK